MCTTHSKAMSGWMDGLDPTEIASPPRAPSVAVLDGCSSVMLHISGWDWVWVWYPGGRAVYI